MCYSTPWFEPSDCRLTNSERSFWGAFARKKMQRRRTTAIKSPSTIPEHVRLQVLRRDRWGCQICGSMQNIQVHHQTFRSHGGKDIEENLICICANCHSSIHG